MRYRYYPPSPCLKRLSISRIGKHQWLLHYVILCVRLVLLKSSDYFHSWIWICQSFNYIQNFTCAGIFYPMLATNLKDKLLSWFFIGLKNFQFLTFVGKYMQNIRKILFKKLFLLPFSPILSVEIDI